MQLLDTRYKKIFQTFLAIALTFVSISLTLYVIVNIKIHTREFYFLISTSFVFYVLATISFAHLLINRDYTYYYYINYLLVVIIYFTIISLDTGVIINDNLFERLRFDYFIDPIRILSFHMYTMFALNFLNVKQTDTLSYKIGNSIAQIYLLLCITSLLVHIIIPNTSVKQTITNYILLCCMPLGLAAITILTYRIRNAIAGILTIGSISFFVGSGLTFIFSTNVLPYPASYFPFNYILFYNEVGTLLECIMFFGSFTYRTKLILEKEAKEKIKSANMRTDIAKDLHDEIGSTLTSINILSSVSSQIIEHEPEKAKEMLQQISIQSKTIQQNMSDIVWSIRNDTEEAQNLATRMREFATQILEPLHINVDFKLQPILETLKLPIAYRKEILLIFKEAINNVAKHAEATQVEIGLYKTLKCIVLSVYDNGLWKGNTSGLGTKSMKDRAKLLGGNLEILVENNNGTLIKLEVPIP